MDQTGFHGFFSQIIFHFIELYFFDVNISLIYLIY